MKLFRVVVQVGDIEAASRFYSTVFGNPGRRVSPGRHYFDCDGTILACVAPQHEGNPSGPAPSADCIYFATAALEQAYAACRAVGADFAAIDVHGDPGGEIATRPWGERSFYVQDPWRNSLCFVDARTIFSGR